MKILIVLGVFLVGVALGYFISVGFAWVIQWLVNELFNKSYDLNLWIAGALLFVVGFIIKNN